MITLKHLLPAIILWGLSSMVFATDLRGRVDGQHADDAPFPVGGAKVDLYSVNPAGQWKRLASVVSGGDGMYYFKDINAGDYFLQVNGKTNFRLAVKAGAQHQEIPPLVVKY